MRSNLNEWQKKTVVEDGGMLFNGNKKTNYKKMSPL